MEHGTIIDRAIHALSTLDLSNPIEEYLFSMMQEVSVCASTPVPVLEMKPPLTPPPRPSTPTVVVPRGPPCTPCIKDECESCTSASSSSDCSCSSSDTSSSSCSSPSCTKSSPGAEDDDCSSLDLTELLDLTPKRMIRVYFTKRQRNISLCQTPWSQMMRLLNCSRWILNRR